MRERIQKSIMTTEGLLIVGLLVISTFLLASAVTLRNQKNTLDSRLEEKTMDLESVSKELEVANDEVSFLNEELDNEKERLDDLEDEFRKVTNTVEDIEKLSQIDKELLQKYSKVSFLNEHYAPPKLSDIDDRYTYGGVEMEIHRSVSGFLDDLLDEADDDDLELKVKSAFRSFGTQSTLKNSYLVTYGSGANTFSADQGFSEHQLGTTVDFTTELTGSLTTSFENTEEFMWLEENAYKYGFVLSYPKGNIYYQYEPWHWRFVGKDLARYLHRKDLNFYDLDQRDIDEYLLEIFD